MFLFYAQMIIFTKKKKPLLAFRYFAEVEKLCTDSVLESQENYRGQFSFESKPGYIAEVFCFKFFLEPSIVESVHSGVIQHKGDWT